MKRSTAHLIYLAISAVPTAVVALIALATANYLGSTMGHHLLIFLLVLLPGAIFSLDLYMQFSTKDAQARAEKAMRGEPRG